MTANITTIFLMCVAMLVIKRCGSTVKFKTTSQRSGYTKRRKAIWGALHPADADLGRGDLEVAQAAPLQVYEHGGARPQTKSFAAETAAITGEFKPTGKTGGMILATPGKGPARSNALSEAAAIPAENGILSFPVSGVGRGFSTRALNGCGRGGPSREHGRVTSDTFETPLPPNARSNAEGGFSSPEGAETMQSQSPVTPTTGNVFSIITTSPHDAPTVHSAIIRAGFVNTADGLVLASRDTGEPLALLDYASHVSTDNTTSRIDVRQGSGNELNMGSRLVADLEHLADHLGGAICTGGGKVLDLEVLNAIAAGFDMAAVQHIEAVTAQRIEAIRTKPQRLPDGTMRLPGALSFTHSTTTARGRRLTANYFDTTPMTYYEGRREGQRRAGELLAHIKARKTIPLLVWEVVAAAIGCKLPSPTWAKPSTANVSSAFLDVLVQMIESAAHNLDHEGFIERAMAKSLKDGIGMAEYERDRHQKAAVKATTTRKARREAKAGTATPKGAGASETAPFIVWTHDGIVSTHETEEQALDCQARIVALQRAEAKEVTE